MKKIITSFLTLLLIVCLIACRNITYQEESSIHINKQTDPSSTQPFPTQESGSVTTPTISSNVPNSEPVSTLEPNHIHIYTTKKHLPTCTEKGFTMHTCACGDSYRSDETSPLGHKYGAVKETEATCTIKGGQVKTCTVCGHEIFENAVAALGHDWSAWEITKEATTTSAGEQVRACSRCGKTEHKTILQIKEPEHEHTYTKTVVAPTCIKKGYTRYTCSCGNTYDDKEVSASGHLYGDWNVTAQPTTTSTGTRTCVCTKCGHELTETIDKLAPEVAEKYESFIDSRIEIKTFPNGAVSYYYNMVGLVDTRSWGDPPSIRITSAGGFKITYLKKDGSKVVKTLKPVDGYVNRMVIFENGSYQTNLIGDFSD